MEACPACTASMRHAGLHCDSQPCIWLKCGKCGCIIDNETGTYFGSNLWGTPDRYIKGGESVCQPPNTPKPNAKPHSTSTKPTDPPQSKNNSASPKAP